jgi:alkanesulfonate monooxygenase SsuD/methylene tetrahydromethanopterin reductase-like flavin-dependent oxidoreductase (luciferase family)
MIAPARDPILLAKQAATLDAVSNGRFTLGLGVGWRTDDFEATGRAYGHRGRELDALIPRLRGIWADAQAGAADRIGPSPVTPGGPEIIVGAQSPAALERAGRLADGYIALGMFAARVPPTFEAVTNAWRAAGRAGAPRLLAGVYFALGDEVQERSRDALLSFYAPGGERLAEAMASTVCTSPEAIREAIAGIEAMGADEVFFWPSVGDRDQLERLAEVAL